MSSRDIRGQYHVIKHLSKKMLAGALAKYSSYVEGTTEKIGTVHTTEVTKVIRLLRKGVFHHDMDAVSDIMELLTTRTYIVQELSMKVTRELMLHEYNCNKDVFPDILKFLRQQFVSMPQFRIVNALELMFMLILRDMTKEAYEVILSNASTDRFSPSPIFQGYGGAIAYMLWKAEGFVKRESSKYCEAMLRYFKAMMTCLMKIGSEEGEYSFFLSLYVKSLIKVGEVDEAVSVLEQYKMRRPQELTTYRLLINVLSSDFGGNSDKITQVRKDLVSLDPSNHEAIPLVNSLLMQDDVDYCHCLSIILNFMDYPVNWKNQSGLSILERIKSEWPECSETNLWKSRLKLLKIILSRSSTVP